jgi:hypothetical protein
MRYRVRLRWGDSAIADWLPVIVPFLKARDIEKQPLGLESFMIKTRGNEAQRNIDVLEIVVAGICREKPIEAPVPANTVAPESAPSNKAKSG